MPAVQDWGTTEAERAEPFPCDAQMPDVTKVWYRGIDVAAPPAVVFRWLCQLRKAPYSYDILDNLGRRSPRTLTPGLEQLELGQKFMLFYALEDFEPDRSITIVFQRFLWAFGRRAVTYRVTAAEGGSRLVAKVRHKKPPLPFGLTVPHVLPWLDLIMMKKQLRTLAKLAEKG
ncbi:MAG: hypothetical protein QOF76_1782 [Solirubrobacteraceae bacterium]|jgi:hypothetical protein|nr:hypothetical protein [Solirubrobacteraceae bacterium]